MLCTSKCLFFGDWKGNDDNSQTLFVGTEQHLPTRTFLDDLVGVGLNTFPEYTPLNLFPIVMQLHDTP